MSENTQNTTPSTTPVPPAQPVQRRRLAPWLIGGGIALVAILATAGIIVAVNYGFDDHDDRKPAASVRSGLPGGAPAQPAQPQSAPNGQTQGHDDHDSNGEGHDDGTDDDGTDEDVTAITALERQRATDAALAATGGGSVTLVDRSDDGDHVFSVDVTRTDGTHVDVELAADYRVVTID